MTKTEEDNVKIAAYEGRLFYGKHPIVKFGGDTGNALPEMKYHESWDWIMPVVQKALKEDAGMNCYQLWLCDSLRTADINEFHYALVDFIKNFNPAPNR